LQVQVFYRSARLGASGSGGGNRGFPRIGEMF
jgi:hypothetical protein